MSAKRSEPGKGQTVKIYNIDGEAISSSEGEDFAVCYWPVTVKVREGIPTEGVLDALRRLTASLDPNRITVSIGRGARTRQHCPACHGQTWKHDVQAFCYHGRDSVPFGAICEDCLEHQHLNLPISGDVPTYAELERQRDAADAALDETPA